MTIWYRQGSASVENGSTSVTGTLTGWLNQVKPGDGITFDDGGAWHEVASVESNTELTLATEYGGETVDGAAYAIDRRSPQWSLASDLAVKVASLLGSITTLILTSGKPNDGIGNNGAIAFDPEAQLFYFKSGGEWDEGTDIKGDGGWSPVFAVVSDDAREVLQVVSWAGGDGDPPATGAYIGASGFTDDIGEASTVSGEDGVDGDHGWSPALAAIQHGERVVLRVASWTGGTGTPPDSGLYIGASGLTATVGDAIDVRGVAGQSFRPDAVVDDLADRDAYDEEGVFYSVLVLKNGDGDIDPMLYFLITPSDTAPVWSDPVPFLAEAESGVTPGTYGGASAVPQITVDAQGRVTDVATVSIPDPVAMAIVFGA